MNSVLDQSMYIDHDGNTFRKLPNWGLGQCGLISLIQLHDVLRNGMDPAVVRKNTCEPTQCMMERVRQLRAQIVAEADTELKEHFDPCLQKDAVARLLKLGHLPTLRTWKEAMSSDSGWLDTQAMMVGAKILGLHDFMIVDTGGNTTTLEKTDGLPLHPLFHPCRVQGYSSLVLYTKDHYEALYKVKKHVFYFNSI